MKTTGPSVSFSPQFRRRLAALALVLAATQTAFGSSPSVRPGMAGPDALLPLLGFLGVTLLCALALGVVVRRLRRAQDDLVEHRNRLDALLHRVPAIVWTVDREMRFTSSRGTVMRDTGAREAELLGVTMSKFFGTDDPSFPPIAAHRQALEGRPAEYRVRWLGRVYQCHVQPLLDAEGRVHGAVGVGQDVTGKEEADERLQRANKMEALARLAGRVAHDFNNALTAILGYCDILSTEFPKGDTRGEDIRSIEKAALRAAATADRLTAFSPHRLNEARPVDLNALVQEMDAALAELLGPRIARVYRLEPGLPLVRVDPAQIREVVRHLAANARDAMPDGGQLVIATQRKRGEDPMALDRARLSVHDTGPGLSEEARAHLFEPYFSTRSREKDRGLGLATCYGLVRQNGGDIGFHSAPGKGTVFHLDFSVWAGETSAPKPTADGEGAPPRGTETILLAEDEDSVRLAVARQLESLGYTVLAAEGGEQALRLLGGEAGGSVRLLLSDVVMPGMTGVELARRVAGARPDVRRLLMSGYAESVLEADGTLPPGTAFLQKPFKPAVLARRVRQALDNPAPSDLIK